MGSNIDSGPFALDHIDLDSFNEHRILCSVDAADSICITNLALDDCTANCHVLSPNVASNIDSSLFDLNHNNLENFIGHKCFNSIGAADRICITNLGLDNCKGNCHVLSANVASNIDSGHFALDHIDLNSFNEHKILCSFDAADSICITNLVLDNCKGNCHVLSPNVASNIDSGPFAFYRNDLESFIKHKCFIESTKDISSVDAADRICITNLAFDDCAASCHGLSRNVASNIDSGPFAFYRNDVESFIKHKSFIDSTKEITILFWMSVKVTVMFYPLMWVLILTVVHFAFYHIDLESFDKSSIDSDSTEFTP